MSDTIIPICVYYNNTGKSFLGSSIFQRKNDGKGKETLYSCPRPYPGWRYIEDIYGVNPMYFPIPIYMSLICAVQSEQGEKQYSTTVIRNQYDPFKNDKKCVYFLAWTTPTPYTTPMYVYENGEVSFERKKKENDNVGQLKIVYVLTKHPKKGTIFVGKKNWFPIQANGIPDFKFSSYMGRCVPDPNGEDLKECTLRHDLNLVRPKSLLDVLNSDEVDRVSVKEKKGGKGNFDVLFLLICVVLGIFFVSLFWIARSVMK